jgi:hypothetical protein
MPLNEEVNVNSSPFESLTAKNTVTSSTNAMRQEGRLCSSSTMGWRRGPVLLQDFPVTKVGVLSEAPLEGAYSTLELTLSLLLIFLHRFKFFIL